MTIRGCNGIYQPEVYPNRTLWLLDGHGRGLSCIVGENGKPFVALILDGAGLRTEDFSCRSVSILFSSRNISMYDYSNVAEHRKIELGLPESRTELDRAIVGVGVRK